MDMTRGHPATQLIAVIALAFICSGPAQAQSASNPNIVRWAEGTIVYRTIEAQRVRATESFRLTVHPDGSRTLRSFVDNIDAARNLNLIHRVDDTFRPLESQVSYWSGGTFQGVGMFIVRGNTLTATVSGPLGTATHNTDVPEGFSIVPHPLATDSWHFWYFDKAKGGSQPVSIYNPQVAPRTGIPVLGHMESGTMTYEGEEQVSVPAGTFATEHYRLNGMIDVWMTGADKLLVRYAMPSADLEYVLATLDVGP